MDRSEDGLYKNPRYIGLTLQDSASTLVEVVEQIVNNEEDLLPGDGAEEEKETEDAEDEEIGEDEEDEEIGEDAPLEEENDKQEQEEAPVILGELYDIGGTSGQSTQLLRKKHYATIVQRTLDVDLLPYVRRQLQAQALHLQLPQTRQNKAHNFCNESVYGSASFVFLDGFLRLTKA